MKDYPMFDSGDLEDFKKTLSKDKLKVLNDFSNFCSISAKELSCIEISRSIVQFFYVCNKPLKEIDLETLREFLWKLQKSGRSINTCNKIKTHLKRFLRWYFKDYPTRFNDLQDIKNFGSRINEAKINSSTLLKKEDVEKIVKSEPRFFWKTFFIVLYETGCRPKEVRLMKWKDVSFNIDENGLSKINVFATKTSRARDVYVQNGTKMLLELRERQKNKDENALIFPAPRGENKPLDKGTVSNWIKERSESAIGRSINPYLLRHSRATELYLNANIPDSIAQKFLGHSKDMKDVYTHMSSEDVKQAVAKSIYNLDDMPPEKKHALELKVEELQNAQKDLLEQLKPFLESKKKMQDFFKLELEKSNKKLIEETKIKYS